MRPGFYVYILRPYTSVASRVSGGCRQLDLTGVENDAVFAHSNYVSRKDVPHHRKTRHKFRSRTAENFVGRAGLADTPVPDYRHVPAER